MKSKELSRKHNWRPLKTLFAAVAISFGSVQAQAETLWEIYQLALEHDPQLAADRATYRAGLENKNIARAALLPQITATASANNTQLPNQNNPSSPGLKNKTRKSRGYQATLDQTLFNLESWFSYQGGKLDSELAAAQFSANQQAMMIRVAQAYFAVLSAADDLETAQAEEEALAKQLEQTQQRFEVGLTAITDVYNARASHDTAVASLLDAKDTLLNNFDALTVLTGQQHETIAPLASDFAVVAPVPAERAAWVEFALKNNFSLKAARLNADSSRYKARASASAHLPTLSGELSYSDDIGDAGNFSNGSSSFLAEPGATKSASISLNVPLFTGGRTSAQRRQTRNQALQAEDQRNLTERQTIENARTQHRNVVTDATRVAARQQAVISNESSVEATQAGYEVGTRNLVDVLDAQRLLYQARRDYSASLYSYITNTLDLNETAGLLSPEDLQRLNAKLNPVSPISRTDALNVGPTMIK
ncbi:MAG: TolC family outer membrane protein [Gammaproteobacteria bacterium]|nr:TolC family outer membrane protein [Gammaproteobacteria bacterium]